MPLPVLPTAAAEELPKMPLPVLPPTAAEELPKMPLLFSNGSEPEDDTGKLVDGKGVDPNLKNDVGDEDATWVEELLLLAATAAGVLVEVAVVLTLLLLAARDELLNIF